MRIHCTARKIAQVGKVLALGALLFSAPVTANANSKYAGIVVDAKTGKTLYASSADAYRYPASLTKIMTLYIVFEEMEAGRLSLNSRLKVSKYASGRPPSKLGLKAGSTIKVKDAILALVTKSANDVATTVAENIGGSEKKFAERMTQTARQLGMKKTTFRNAHGLPNSGQRTTARDMATLGRAIQERFPKEYGYFKTRVYSYKGRRYGNHNKLLGRVKGVDGIKTGYIRASGFNLVTSVKRNGRHIVAVVMGGRTGARRNAHMTKLIGQYLPKASKGKRTAPLLVTKTPAVRTFDAAALKIPPLPQKKPGTASQLATGAPMVLASSAPTKSVVAPAVAQAPAPTPVPGFGNQIPLPPRAIKNRIDHTFSIATALPPVPRESPDAPLTTQSVSRTQLLQAAQRATASKGLELNQGPVQTASSDVQAIENSFVKTVKVETISVNPIKVETVRVNKATPAPIQIEPVKVAVAPAPETVQEEVDTSEIVTLATSDRQDIEPGWQVQIAAAESEGQAITMLKQAKAKTGSSLRGRSPYTEPVDSNGQTLYRARFVGFETKTAAWKACRSLKRAKYACFAIYQ
ncbi:MAG: D-alanyl-D-alanine carboxypeptidase [Roseibium sp.]